MGDSSLPALLNEKPHEEIAQPIIILTLAIAQTEAGVNLNCRSIWSGVQGKNFSSSGLSNNKIEQCD
jgi:hypothetical protein